MTYTIPDPIRAVSLAKIAAAALVLSACGSDSPASASGGNAGGIDSPTDTDRGDGEGSSGEGSMPDLTKLDVGAPVASGGVIEDGTDDEQCSASVTGTRLQPVYLAFAFDVSGSMGKLDFEWHDPELKWEPVVAATTAFFADDTSSGLSATLTFFPAEDDRCDAGQYATPDVPLTALPSTAFAQAIDDVAPETEDDWRGGTPTYAVTEATLAYLEQLGESEPLAKRVFVLVTDGVPQGCDDETDDIQTTIDRVAASADSITTYVIGVQNPPGGPDAVSDLDAIAVAGGSDTAFLVETGNAEATVASLVEAIASIRESLTACTFDIPATPNGEPFDEGKVNLGVGDMALGYDAQCSLPGSWRYDDPTAPTQIELCPATCDAVQVQADGQINVEFGCETRPAIP